MTGRPSNLKQLKADSCQRMTSATETRHSYHSTCTNNAASTLAAQMRSRLQYTLADSAGNAAARGCNTAATAGIDTIDSRVDSNLHLRVGKHARSNSYSRPEQHRYDVLQHGHGTVGQLALLYAIFLTLFGFMFPLSNYVSVRPQPSWMLIAFYIILYCTSIGFLLFFMIWVMSRPSHKLFVDGIRADGAGELVRLQESERSNVNAEFRIGRFAVSESYANFKDDNQNNQSLLHSKQCDNLQLEEQMQQQQPSTTGEEDMNCSYQDETELGSRAEAAGVTFNVQDTQLSSCDTISRQKAYMKRINSTLIQNAKELGVHEIQAYSVLSLQESHSPSFFLRIACFIFGGLKIAHDLLHIIDTVTSIKNHCTNATAAGYLIQYCLSIVFTVLQTFFIFKYSKVSMNIHQKLSVIGFMHLMATNMCVWFQAILLETSHSAKKLNRTNGNSANSLANHDHEHAGSCSQEVFWRMGPYLFPFTIEYSLMSAFSCYVLYCNVGKFLDVILKKGLNVGKKCLRNRKKSQTSFSASCYKSDKGFFLGALQIIFGLVSSVYFIVYINDGDEGSVTSKYIFLLTDLLLLTMNLVLCIIAYCKMCELTLIRKVGTGPDSWLLGITLMGVLAFEMFQLFGAAAETTAFLLLRVAKGIMCIVQSTFQVFLVLDGEKRRSITLQALEEKPGREMIAALLLGNLALWIVYTLEVREINGLPNFNDAYFTIASEILSYLCSPLIIFFRFHSACCFVEVWRHSYGSKSTNALPKREHNKDLDAFSIGFHDSNASLPNAAKADAGI